MPGKNCLIKAEKISSPIRVFFFFEFQFLIRTECFQIWHKNTLFPRGIIIEKSWKSVLSMNYSAWNNPKCNIVKLLKLSAQVFQPNIFTHIHCINFYGIVQPAEKLWKCRSWSHGSWQRIHGNVEQITNPLWVIQVKVVIVLPWGRWQPK